MSTIRVQEEPGVLRLTMSRPDRLNSLTPDVLGELEAVLTLVEAATDIRAVVIHGSGTAFCVGMDQTFLQECFADVPGVFVPFCRRYHALLRRMEAAPVVFVAAVDGLARAGGFELLLACDLVIATTTSKVGDNHIRFGMIPGAGAVPRAVRKLGDMRARDLLLTGRWLYGQQIAEAGVALQVVEPTELDDAVTTILDNVRGLSRACLARMKRLINSCADVSLDEGLDLELAEFIDYHDSEPTAADGFHAWTRQRQQA